MTNSVIKKEGAQSASAMQVFGNKEADAGVRCQALTQLLTTKKAEIQTLLPQNVNPDRFIQSILLAARNNADILDCDIASIFKAAYTIASTGLMLDPHFGHAYFVPFWNSKAGKREAQALIGYKGLMSLVRNSQEIAKWEVMVVHEHDEFNYQIGTDSVFMHRPNIFGDRGEVRGYYSLVTYNSGLTDLEIMSKSDIEKIRLSSAGKDKGPWSVHYDEMAKKTVVRRHSKRLPMALTKQLTNAIALDNAQHKDTPIEVNTATGEIIEYDPPMIEANSHTTKTSQLDQFAGNEPVSINTAEPTPTEPPTQADPKALLIKEYYELTAGKPNQHPYEKLEGMTLKAVQNLVEAVKSQKAI